MCDLMNRGNPDTSDSVLCRVVNDIFDVGTLNITTSSHTESI